MQAPDAESLAYLEAHVIAGHGPAGRAWVNALGGALGRASRFDAGAADRVEVLENRLDGTRDEADTRALLMALGNAGQASSVPLIERRLQAEDPQVRAAAVGALAHFPGEPTAGRLLDLVSTERDTSVQRAVVRAWGDLSPSESMLAQLAAALAASPPSPELAQGWLVNVRKWSQVTSPDGLVPLVRVLVERGPSAGPAAHALREFLASLERR